MATALFSLPAASLAPVHRQCAPRSGASAISARPPTRSNNCFPLLGNTSKVLHGFRNAIDLGPKRRVATVFLPNVNPSPGDSSNDEIKSTSSTEGPPLLTILAGILVFLLVCWVMGSLVMRLISLVINVPSPK